MTEKRTSVSNKWVFISGAIGLATFTTYAYYSAGFSDIISVIQKINLPMYAAAFLLVAADMMFNSLAWRSLLSKLGSNITIWRAYTLTWMGFFVDATLPSGWSGDLFKAYILTKDGDIKGGNSGASAVVVRLIFMSIGLTSIITGLLLAVSIYRLPLGVIIPITLIVTVFAISMTMAILIITKPRATKGIVKFSSRLTHYIRRKPWDGQKFQSSWEATLTTFHDGLKTLTMKRKTLVKPIVLCILAWSCEIFALVIVFNALGYSIAPDKLFIVFSINSALESQTTAFAGFAQIVTSSLYIILAIAPAISVAATLLSGVSAFWFKLSLSYIAFSCVALSRCFCFINTRLRAGWPGRRCREQQETSLDGVSSAPEA